MNWFKNLNATPRLMLSFGVMLALTLGVSYLAVTNLSLANDRVDALFHEDMIGMEKADGITINVATSARLALHAVVHSAEPAAVAEDEKNELASTAELRADLDDADKLFVNKRGIEQLAIIRRTLPSYEEAQAAVFQALKAKDFESARSRMDAVSEIRETLRSASDIAATSKREHAEEQFQANDRAYRATRSWMFTAAAVSLVLGLILSVAIARGFSGPLGLAVAALERVAEGDMTASLDIHTKDEVGRMAGALNVALQKLNATLQEVADSANHASSSAQQLAAAAESIAAGAQEQAASLEETSASLEEITATVRQSADNAHQASQLASGSRDSAERGQEVVSTAITAMSEINAASAKISDIISTIDEIAFQTNLLAVNAAVEAARAGEEGRGFAVVASEVRSLAQRSAGAAKEIKGLIQDSLRKVEAGSTLVNRSGETLQGIVGSVKRVTDIVGEIAASAAEQSTGVEQVNTAVTQMDQVTQSNSAQTEELSATAQALSEQAARLQELVATFKLVRSANSGREFASYRAQPNSHSHQDSAHQDSAQHLSLAAHAPLHVRQLSKPTRSSSKPPATTRSRKPKASQQPAYAAAAISAGGSDDASFEEF
jgi:methyl-accepting chemotaxis protein